MVRVNCDWYIIYIFSFGIKPSQSLFKIRLIFRDRGNGSFRVDEQTGVISLHRFKSIPERFKRSFRIFKVNGESTDLTEEGILMHLFVFHDGSCPLVEDIFVEVKGNQSIPPQIMIQKVDRSRVFRRGIFLFDPKMFEPSFK